MIGTVYHIFNTLDGKSDVGQTWDTLDSRWKQHCGTRGEMVVMRAIRKHGPSSFVRTVLTMCENQDDLDAAEDAFILELGALFPAGYNLKRGGSHGKHTEESRRKMSESHKGKKPPASSAFGKDGHTRTDKTVRCTNDGKVFPSLKIAAEFYGTYSSNICKVLKGERPHTKGLRFEYLEELKG